MIPPTQSAEGGAQSTEWESISFPPDRSPRQDSRLKRRRLIILAFFLIVLLHSGLIWLIWHIRNEFARSDAERAYAAARDLRRLERLLPSWATLDTEFAYSPATLPGSGHRPTTTIREKLEEIGAYCKDGTIHDRQGRKVIFHWATEWGYVPSRVQEASKWAEDVKAQKLEAEGACVIWMWTTEIPK